MLSRSLAVIIGLLAARIAMPATAKSDKFRVSISQIVEHPSLDAVRKGVIDYLNENGYKNRVQIDYLNAQGNMVTNTQIAQKILGKRPDAIVAIGTPAAQAAISKNTTVPVLFSPISDPVGAKLVKSLNLPEGIATGTSDRSPINEQLDLIKKLVPHAKTIAILYNSGETNSIAVVARLKTLAQALGLKIVEGPVQNTAMVFAAASALKADAIYVPTDNTVVSAIDAVIRAGIATKTPVFTGESESVVKGAIASIAVNYYRLGRTTGEMLVKVLEKKDTPAKMPVAFQSDFELHINLRNAERMGVRFPDAILKTAIQHK